MAILHGNDNVIARRRAGTDTVIGCPMYCRVSARGA
jgi:hypothetical protein